MPDVVAIIQARMGSTRLPGKVLMPMAGVPMICRVIDAVRKAASVDTIAVATPEYRMWSLVDVVTNHGANCYCDNEENDVLGRFATVAARRNADIIVRICADSPLIRPDLIDDCVQRLRDSLCHYVSYTLPSGEVAIETKRGVYPEAFTARALRFANDHVAADDTTYREHVTTTMRNNLGYNPWLVTVTDDDGLNCAVDTQEDFDRVEQLIMEREAVPA